jgi:dihydroflavonol-4-reductase
MLNVVAEVVGVRPPLVCLPSSLLHTFSFIVRGLTRLGFTFPLSSEQVWLSVREVYFDDAKAIRDLGYTHTPLERAVEQCYRWYQCRGGL